MSMCSVYLYRYAFQNTHFLMLVLDLQTGGDLQVDLLHSILATI